MSHIPRKDPRRKSTNGPNGLKRLSISKPSDIEEEAYLKPLRTTEPFTSWHMAIAHSDRGSLSEHARQAIAAAAILADAHTGVLAIVIGELREPLDTAGADAVAVFSDFDSTRFQPEQAIAAVLALTATYQPAHIFFPDAATGDGDLGRRLIAALGATSATNVLELDASHVAVPWSSGVAFATQALPRIILLAPGSVDSDLPFAGAGKLLAVSELIDAAKTKGSIRDLGLEETSTSGIALEEADFIVSAGHGVRNVDTVETLAKTLGAAVGASRVAVDEGKFTRDRQIGATGKTVTASAYIAVGISGAVQHLQGIKDCRHVIAINKDAGAPIAKRADLTIVGDAEDVMQALMTRIAQARAQREIPEES